MVRRLLFFSACTAVGVGVLILLTSGTRAGGPVGVPFLVILMLGGAWGGRWGRGPVAGGEPAPRLARAGAAVLLLSALAGAMVAWRPAVGAGLPVGSFLICTATGGLLLIPVGVMGRKADAPK